MSSLELSEGQEHVITELLKRVGVSSVVEAGAGKGKTLCPLSLSSILKEKGLPHRLLVVAPKAAISSFRRDTKKFEKDLDLEGIFISSPRNMESWFGLGKQGQADIDVLAVASHVLAEFKRSGNTFLNNLDGFAYMVLDEAHDLRVSTSRKYLNTLYVQRKYNLPVIAMTATLFHTRLDDVFFLMQFIDKGVFPSYEAFKRRYMNFISKDVHIQRRYTAEVGTSTFESQTRLQVFDGYKDEVSEVWEKIKPFVITMDVEPETFTTNYEYLYYDISDVEELKGKLSGDGVYSILHLSLSSVASGRVLEITKKPSDLVERIEKGIRIPRRIDTLKVGDVIAAKSGAYLLTSLTEEGDDTKLAQVILPVVQRYLSKDMNKYKALRSIADTEGVLVYCEYIPTAKWLSHTLQKDYPDRKVFLLDGSVTDKQAVLKRVDWARDICVVTASAAQSLDYYFRKVIIYEPVGHPGKFMQIKGRITRQDSEHREVYVYMLCARDSPEEYYHHRLCMFLKQSKAYDIVLPMETGFDSLDLLKKIKLWGLLRNG